jgi:hypothetical protein
MQEQANIRMRVYTRESWMFHNKSELIRTYERRNSREIGFIQAILHHIENTSYTSAEEGIGCHQSVYNSEEESY